MNLWFGSIGACSWYPSWDLNNYFTKCFYFLYMWATWFHNILSLTYHWVNKLLSITLYRVKIRKSASMWGESYLLTHVERHDIHYCHSHVLLVMCVSMFHLALERHDIVVIFLVMWKTRFLRLSIWEEHRVVIESF